MSLDTDTLETSRVLSVPEAQFLLTDLNLKLSHVFGAAKRSCPLGNTGPDKGELMASWSVTLNPLMTLCCCIDFFCLLCYSLNI